MAPRLRVPLGDQASEAAVAGRADGDFSPELVAREQCRRLADTVPRFDRRSRFGGFRRARQEVFRIREKLLADARRRRGRSLNPSGRLLLDLADTNFRGRIGWQEMVVHASDGARVQASTAPATSISKELLAYPKDLLSSPPETAEARAHRRCRPAAGTAPARPARGGTPVCATGDGGFVSPIAQQDLGSVSS